MNVQEVLVIQEIVQLLHGTDRGANMITNGSCPHKEAFCLVIEFGDQIVVVPILNVVITPYFLETVGNKYPNGLTIHVVPNINLLESDVSQIVQSPDDSRLVP